MREIQKTMSVAKQESYTLPSIKLSAFAISATSRRSFSTAELTQRSSVSTAIVKCTPRISSSRNTIGCFCVIPATLCLLLSSDVPNAVLCQNCDWETHRNVGGLLNYLGLEDLGRRVRMLVGPMMRVCWSGNEA
ncbi:hypothetical protein ACS0TY_010557 [Phlomoides rotata]